MGRPVPSISSICLQLRKSVPCHVEGLSCGRPCNKALPCGRHNCIKACHEGSCLDSANAEERSVHDDKGFHKICINPHFLSISCGQPCTEIRESCGHPCNAPCHAPPCPATPCKERVKVTCKCGHRSAMRTCSDQASDFQRLQVRVQHDLLLHALLDTYKKRRNELVSGL